MNQPVHRGDLFYANLGVGVGSEQSGYRPVVIIQNNTGNHYSPTVIVAAITSKVEKPRRLPTHAYIDESALKTPSVALLEQLRTLDKKRLTKYIGALNCRQISDIDCSLAISIDLAKFYNC